MAFSVIVVGIGKVFETNDLLMASTKFHEWMVQRDKTIIMMQGEEVIQTFWGNDFVGC